MESLLKEQNQTQLLPIIEMGGNIKNQLENLDWDELNHAIEECVVKKGHAAVPESYDPAPYYPLEPETEEDRKLYQEATAKGIALISSGKVAAFTVAGGQGTRLGYDGPKGTLPVSPVKNKSLFQMFAEQIEGIEKKYDTTLPWYIMCSPLNHDQTVDFFIENNFFGLSSANVKFFIQGVIPATDFNGKLLAASKDCLALSPNGHGGSLKALIDSGSIADMKARGVEHISYFQVDNPLISIANPLFIGLHALKNSDMSSRSLTKKGPLEKLGNFVIANGRLTIVEYSDLPEEKARETDDQGRLRYRAGSPAIHVIRRDFVEKFADDSLQLPWHRAEKKVPFINDQGEKITPEEPNAVKFETFVFDALPLAENPIILEADRAEEFSPVKNKSGADSLESSQADQFKRSITWLQRAGALVDKGAEIELSCGIIASDDLAATGEFKAGQTYYVNSEGSIEEV